SGRREEVGTLRRSVWRFPRDRSTVTPGPTEDADDGHVVGQCALKILERAELAPAMAGEGLPGSLSHTTNARLKRKVVRPYWRAAILPTTWTPGPRPGVGLSTTVSPWSGKIPIRGRTVRA